MIDPGKRSLRSTRSRGLLAALLAVCMLAMAAAQPATAAPRPFFTGITNIGNRSPLAFERTRATGAQFIRIPLYWGGTAPETLPAAWNPENPADPNYEWGESDEDVVRAVAAGLTPVLQVDGTPAWAQRCQTPAVVVPAICNPDPAALKAFAVAAARRYDGHTAGLPRVTYWQALNEPNLSLFFFPQFGGDGKPISPELYRDLVNGFYAGIKSVDTSNTVLAAGLGPIAVPPWTIGPMQFARQLLCMRGTAKPRPTGGDCGGGVHFDVFAIQPYTTGGPTREGRANDVQIGGLAKLQTLIRAADAAGRIANTSAKTPLWITEFSWDSSPPDPGGLPMRIAKRWTAEALHKAWSAGVDHFFWYSLRDDPPSGKPFSQSLESGLYFRGPSIEHDQPKPVLAAFRFPFVAYPGGKGVSFWGRTPNSKRGKVTIQLLDGKSWRKAVTVRADEFGIFQGTVPGGYGSGGKGAARAHYAGQPSVPFSMKQVADFRHPPFG